MVHAERFSNRPCLRCPHFLQPDNVGRFARDGAAQNGYVRASGTVNVPGHRPQQTVFHDNSVADRYGDFLDFPRLVVCALSSVGFFFEASFIGSIIGS